MTWKIVLYELINSEWIEIGKAETIEEANAWVKEKDNRCWRAQKSPPD